MGGKDTGIGPVEGDVAQPVPNTPAPANIPERNTAGDTAAEMDTQQTGEKVNDVIGDAREASEQAKASGQAQTLEDGKKRKVALHVAYIGAGYAVRSTDPHSTSVGDIGVVISWWTEGNASMWLWALQGEELKAHEFRTFRVSGIAEPFTPWTSLR